MFVNVAFEGGGIKGLAYVGAIRYLEKRGYRIFRASGTSVGSIFASLAVAGYNSFEIEDIIEELDHSTIATKNTFKGTIKERGIYTIKNLEAKIKEVLKRKGKVTFQDVKYGDDYLLKIVVTEWKTKQKLIFPNDLRKYGYDPDAFLIAKAVAMSCSLPILFSVYQVEGFKFVDGGLTDNFPIELVIDGIHPVIGLTLKKNSKKIVHHSVDIIYIDSLDVKVGQFKKGLNKRSDLYNAGYMSIKEYFEHKKRK